MTLLARPAPSVESLKRDPAAPRHHFDWSLVLLPVVLLGVGLATVFSATKGSGDAPDTSMLTRQLVAALVGLPVMIGLAFTDYRRLREVGVIGYIAVIGLLGVVLASGRAVNGSERWFSIGPVTVQPAEPAKLAVVVVLALFLTAHRDRLDPLRVGLALALAALPSALILLQPDIGTVLVFMAVALAMLAVAGARPRHLAALALVGIIASVAVLNTDLVADYQRNRLLVFIDRASDRDHGLAESYNVAQSETAISLGGITGWGWGNGPQTQDNFVPEQHTDFIFTAVGEELGFVGAGLVLLLFLALCLRILRVAQLARDDLGALLCCGVLAMIVFQVFQNVGMTMRIMPVTGIPLPFLSYGGSSLVTTFAALGVVMSVHMHRFR